MLIAKTKEESDLFCEQELSHILTKNITKPIEYKRNDRWVSYITKEGDDNFLVAVEKKETKQRLLKTKTFGALPVFDSIEDFLDSKYNRCSILLYCESRTSRNTNRGSFVEATMSDNRSTMCFLSRERNGSGGMFKNEVNGSKSLSAFISVLERNNNTVNGVQILFLKELNK
ncbi:MAG TPA: hypothetical protein VGA80_06730 [Flavobacteriaceae bacterium]